MLVPTYKSTQYHNPEDYRGHLHRYESSICESCEVGITQEN
jgi:hypothetical protein